MTKTLIELGNLGLVEEEGRKLFKCLKCGYELCEHTQEYKDFALKNEAPISKAQPDYLASKTDLFVLREYYCPGCAAMFEVDMVAKGEKQIRSARFDL